MTPEKKIINDMVIRDYFSCLTQINFTKLVKRESDH